VSFNGILRLRAPKTVVLDLPRWRQRTMILPSTSPGHGGDLQQLQRRRKHLLRFAIGLFVLLLMVTASSWRTWPQVHELFERMGLVLILVCVFGRT
jgi:hypothetical protein